MCGFCKSFDFSTARVEIGKRNSCIHLALCCTKFPKEQQFKYCPVCVKPLDNLVKEMVGEGR